MQYDLIMIKDKYCEKMSHLCRALFPTLLETEGLLYNLLESTFAPSRFLYNDIVENNLENSFKNYIYSLLETDEKEIIVDKTPTELLDEAGYILYECKTEQDVEKFKKYYDKSEVLCTFDDIKGRLYDYYVFFAIKKNVDEIKRENFNNPNRQDEYGTSVISIQFTKGTINTISIKNRYNHTVMNPDATFSNNLDNIILGLTKSFEQTYNLDIMGYYDYGFEIPNYVMVKGKFYKYNHEIHNIYYCPNNIIIKDFQVVDEYLDKGRYLVFDYFVLDMKEKTIKLYDNNRHDGFLDGLTEISKIQIKKENDLKHICLEIKGYNVIITLNDKNQIIAYQNNTITEVGDMFLYYDTTLETIYLENVKYIGNRFLAGNENLKFMNLPVLEEIGDYFLYNNNTLTEISMESVTIIGHEFMSNNKIIKSIYLPNLYDVGRRFLYENRRLTSLNFPHLAFVGENFIRSNEIISKVNMPWLAEIGSYFLYNNIKIEELILPNLIECGRCFMYNNDYLKTFIAPKLEIIGEYYLEYNKVLSNVDVPEDIRNKFIYNGRFKDNFKQKQKKIGTR